MLCVSMEDNLKARAVLTSIQIRKKTKEGGPKQSEKA